MPIFGAAYAAPNKGTTILYWFRSLSAVLSPTENSRIKGLFKAFKWFSSNFTRSPLNSSTFQACANPVLHKKCFTNLQNFSSSIVWLSLLKVINDSKLIWRKLSNIPLSLICLSISGENNVSVVVVVSLCPDSSDLESDLVPRRDFRDVRNFSYKWPSLSSGK